MLNDQLHCISWINETVLQLIFKVPNKKILILAQHSSSRNSVREFSISTYFGQQNLGATKEISLKKFFNVKSSNERTIDCNLVISQMRLRILIDLVTSSLYRCDSIRFGLLISPIISFTIKKSIIVMACDFVKLFFMRTNSEPLTFIRNNNYNSIRFVSIIDLILHEIVKLMRPKLQVHFDREF